MKRHLWGNCCWILLVSLLASCAGGDATDGAARIAAQAAVAPGLEFMPGDRTGGLPPDALIRNGLLRHPLIAEAAEEITVSAAELRRSRSSLYPRVEMGIAGGISTADSGDEPSIQLTTSQLLTDFGQSGLAIARADLNILISHTEFQIAVGDVIKEVVGAVLEVQSARALVSLRTEHLERMHDLRSRLQQRRIAGASSEPEVLEMERKYADAELRLNEASLVLAEAELVLMELAGGGRLSGTLAPPTRGSAHTDGQEGPEVALARMQLDAAQIDLELARRARLPRVAIEGVAEQPLDGSAVHVGLRVNLGSRLFEGGGIRAQIEAAEGRVTARGAALERSLQDYRLDQARLERQRATLTQRQNVLARQIALADDARRLYLNQYFDLGTRDLLDLLRAEEDYFELQADLLAARIELISVEWVFSVKSGNMLHSLGIADRSVGGVPLSL